MSQFLKKLANFLCGRCRCCNKKCCIKKSIKVHPSQREQEAHVIQIIPTVPIQIVQEQPIVPTQVRQKQSMMSVQITRVQPANKSAFSDKKSKKRHKKGIGRALSDNVSFQAESAPSTEKSEQVITQLPPTTALELLVQQRQLIEYFSKKSEENNSISDNFSPVMDNQTFKGERKSF
jgi:hypothetical protein